MRKYGIVLEFKSTPLEFQNFPWSSKTIPRLFSGICQKTRSSKTIPYGMSVEYPISAFQAEFQNYSVWNVIGIPNFKTFRRNSKTIPYGMSVEYPVPAFQAEVHNYSVWNVSGRVRFHTSNSTWIRFFRIQLEFEAGEIDRIRAYANNHHGGPA